MPLLTVTEAARRRGVTKWAIHRWIKAGLRHQRVGERTIIIEQRDLDKFVPRSVGRPYPSRLKTP